MDIVWKILAFLAICSLDFIKVWIYVRIIEDIRKFRDARKKQEDTNDLP